jgi:glycosyltransferase involved in cell wall biosynthesis
MPNDGFHTSPPRVSVIIPTFNRAGLTGEAVDSVLAQSYQDFEVLIVDDGSTDDTPRVIEARFGTDRRVRCLRRPNSGPGPARNHGIRQARGELIAFLDSDDLWHPDKLRLQVEQLDLNPAAVLSFCDAVVEGGKPGRETRFRSKRFHGDTTMRGIVEWNFPMCTPSVLIRRAVFNEIGLFDEAFTCSEDWDLWIRIVASYPIAYVDRLLLITRRREDNISRTRILQKWRSDLRLWQKHETLLLRCGCPRDLVRRKLAHAHKKIAQTCCASGDFREARVHYMSWWILEPWQVLGLFWWVALSVRRPVAQTSR